MLELTGKTAVITGASAGIGRETAILFAKQGAKVVLVARRTALLEELADEIRAAGGEATAMTGDVTDPAVPDAVVAKAVETYGSVDILVNDAGISDCHKPAVRCTDEHWAENVAVNETGVFRFCRAALRQMTKQGSGAIVNISSIGGYYSIAGVSYSAAKAAVIGLTKNIAIQYAGTGIRCNAVCPGPTNTSMLEPDPDMDVEMMEITARRFDPNAGICEPIDQANAILFFAADESASINGQILVVDKGACI